MGKPLNAAALADLLAALINSPQIHVLLTGAAPGKLPLQCLQVNMDDEPQAHALFEHFAPDAVIWSGPIQFPRLMARLAASGLPAALVDLSHDDLQLRRQRRQLGDLLAAFSQAFCVDELAASELRSLGLVHMQIENLGPLRPLELLPPDTSALRRALSQRLGGRPVWVALGAHTEGLAQLTAAHTEAQRSNPGLVMLLVPAKGTSAKPLLDDLIALGLNADPAKSPARDLNILVFESDDQAVIACRLASVCVLASSLSENAYPISPLLPAYLGAAVLHGPALGNFADDFGRLAAAKASRIIADPAQLGTALAEALRPDMAATLAIAAWTMLSEGAEIITRLAALAHDEAA